MLNSTWITCIHWPPIQRNEGFAQSESVLSPGVLKKSSLWTDRFWSLLQLWIQIRSERFLIRMNSIITRRIAIRTAIMMRIIIFSSLKIKFIFVISFFCLLSIEINLENPDLRSNSLIGPKILNDLFIKTHIGHNESILSFHKECISILGRKMSDFELEVVQNLNFKWSLQWLVLRLKFYYNQISNQMFGNR